jgi:putative endonuclease
MYNVYAIYNKEADKFYIGQTKDTAERLRIHNNHGFRGYTSRFPGKWELIYEESVATRSEALKREKQLKSFRGREFIKQFIPG